MMRERTLRVLTVASEAVPFAKTGGLADVAGALPAALTTLGCEVRCVMPRYRQIDREKFNLKRVVECEPRFFAGELVDREVWCVERSGVLWYFIDAPCYFDRDGLYTVDGEDYPDNLERFTFFAQEVLALIRHLDWQPDIIHCHDWQTGLIPVYLKIPVSLASIDTGDPFYRRIKTLFTIHNIAYQGLFPKEKLPLTGIGWKHFTFDKLEYWGKLNFLKAGLVFADKLNTVSKRYSEEIQTREFGRGMEGVLSWRSRDLTGILNGIDPTVWNPASDEHLPANFTVDHLRGKQTCKRALLKEHGLKARTGTPLIGMIGRLDAQKGLDLIEEALPDIMRLGVQMVILGTGAPEYHKMLEKAAQAYPDQLAANLTFDNALAHRIEAGSDLFLMPSKFEPCGLNQMYSLRYGAVPIVQATGGLADTISDYDPKAKTGNGFSFTSYTAEALVGAVRRAVGLYPDRKAWLDLVRTGMKQDFSWKASAREYLALYRGIVG